MKKKFFLVLVALCLGTLGMIPDAVASPGSWVSSLVLNKRSQSTLISITNIGSASETVTVKVLDINGAQITEMNNVLAAGAVWKFATAGGGGGPSGTANLEGYLEVSTADNDASETLLPWAAIVFGPGSSPVSAVSVGWAKR